MTFTTNTHHRINQALAKAGSRVVLDWNEINDIGLEDPLIWRVSVFDSTKESVQLAMVAIETALDLSQDAEDMEMPGRTWYAVTGDNARIYALNKYHTHEIVGQDHFFTPGKWGYGSGCNVRIHQDCVGGELSELAGISISKLGEDVHIIPVKHGIFICLFKSCTPCRDWFYLSGPEKTATRNPRFRMDNLHKEAYPYESLRDATYPDEDDEDDDPFS